ncbi:siderophore ferric iron reductase [Vibrio azureus]|uniref:Uncharacterized protein n=1 Tax=Vibrio azureus NBRC 104587 TaxID=1219077 RepID=U3APR7_9VIBR|nr:siderophore ferric iron reductase [Vibrio azureus]AUI86324.1 siderophore ferric iron reductase [Vibrio azureus]GAD75765.1 hypothetical protein VAZ01S_029_00350 [Vibrio azureus NBRC 104587]
MDSISFLDDLFRHSKQINPHLSGEIKTASNDVSLWPLIDIQASNSQSIRGLYESLQHQHPEAGSAYWLTRTWSLLCWQPIYLACVSVYCCKGLPKLSYIKQEVQPCFISGYQFEQHHHYIGEQKELITYAGQELQTLFCHFREEINQWTRIRPGFTHYLFADGILSCLVKLQWQLPALANRSLIEQAKLWLAACNLPEKLIDKLKYNQKTKQLTFTRTSCCFVYKRHDRELCQNCPRQPNNKR